MRELRTEETISQPEDCKINEWGSYSEAKFDGKACLKQGCWHRYKLEWS